MLAQESGRDSMRSLVAILLILCPLFCAAQEAESLPIRQGDHLHISVRRNPDFTVSEVVSSDGSISLPFINDVKVAGLTVQEAQKLLAEKLRPFIANPEVTVTILDRPEPKTLPSIWPFQRAAFQFPESPEVRQLRIEIRRTQSRITALKQRLQSLGRQEKQHRVGEQIGEQLIRSFQDLTNLETMLAGYLAADRANSAQQRSDKIQEELDKLRPHQELEPPRVVPIPPEHVVKASNTLI